MKTVFKNSLLVTVLAGLLVLPMSGFSLFYYPKLDTAPSRILGVNSDSPMKVKVRVLDQVDLRLSLSGDSSQKFYNVIPEEYLSDEYSEYVVAPRNLSDSGYSFEILDNGLSKDLVVMHSGDLVKSKIVDVSVLIMRATPF